MRRRRHVFSASLVVTVALGAGCDKQAPRESEISHNPPMPGVDAAVALTPVPVDAAPAPPDARPLPAAPPGTAVYQDINDACRMVGGEHVLCPPTVALPRRRQIHKGGMITSLDDRTLTCGRRQEMSCPGGASCNPPGPEPVACPQSLLPTLMPGVVPTSRKKGECFLGDVEVACQTSLDQVPDPDHPGATIRYRARSKDCWRTWPSECDPGVKCNPPEPEQVPCPDALKR